MTGSNWVSVFCGEPGGIGHASWGSQGGKNDVATDLNNLGGLYLAQGNLDKAEQFCNDALQIREKALGAEHEDVVESLKNCAAVLRKKNQVAAAEKLEARAKSIRDKEAAASPASKTQ